MVNDKNSDRILLVAGGVVALAYFGVLNPLLKLFGIKKSDEERKDIAEFNTSLETTMDEVLATQKPTYTPAQLKGFADVVHNAIRYSSVSDDYEKAGLYLSMVRNDADIYSMIKYFGRREECYFGVICYHYYMPEMVSKNLSKSKIAAINDNYARKGIKFRW